MKIYKYQMPVTDEYALSVPPHSKVLSVHELDTVTLAVWILLDPDTDGNDHGITFRIFGTGNPIEPDQLEGMDFLDTVVTRCGLVWHVFYRMEG